MSLFLTEFIPIPTEMKAILLQVETVCDTLASKIFSRGIKFFDIGGSFNSSFERKDWIVKQDERKCQDEERSIIGELEVKKRSCMVDSSSRPLKYRGEARKTSYVHSLSLSIAFKRKPLTVMNTEPI